MRGSKERVEAAEKQNTALQARNTELVERCRALVVERDALFVKEYQAQRTIENVLENVAHLKADNERLRETIETYMSSKKFYFDRVLARERIK